jgi:hypothetical protein
MSQVMSQAMSQEPGHEALKPLHPRAARPVLERLLAQSTAQESDQLAEIWNTLQPSVPELSPRALKLLHEFGAVAGREALIERLLDEI